MTTPARVRYHTTEWPAACHAQGWLPSDKERRQNVALDCMFLIHGPACTTSDPRFRAAETTALFCYLRHLADPDNITLKLRWNQCQANYTAFNDARQADYWQQIAYGDRPTRLTRDRFGNARLAAGYPAEVAPDPSETRQRLLTMRARAHSKSMASAS